MNCTNENCGHDESKHAAPPTGCMVASPEPCPCSEYQADLSEPLPCPWCGKTPQLISYDVGDEAEPAKEFEISCSNSGHIAQVVGDSREAAVAKWNWRG